MWNSNSYSNDSVDEPGDKLTGLKNNCQYELYWANQAVVHNEELIIGPQEEEVRLPSNRSVMRAKINEASRAKLMKPFGSSMIVRPKENVLGNKDFPTIPMLLPKNDSDNNNFRDLLNTDPPEICPTSSEPEIKRLKGRSMYGELDEEVLDTGNANLRVIQSKITEKASSLKISKARQSSTEKELLFRTENPHHIAQEDLLEQEPKKPREYPRHSQLFSISNPAFTPHQLNEIPIFTEENFTSERQFSEVTIKNEQIHNMAQDQNTEKTRNSISILDSRKGLEIHVKYMREFLTNPVPLNRTVQCTIRREKGGFARMYPKYYMHFSGDWEFLLAAKKRGGNRTSNYMITMSQNEFKKKSLSYLAKVRSNFKSTEFHMYDRGLNPTKKAANEVNVRQELLAVLYKPSLIGSNRPRKFSVLLPLRSPNETHISKPLNKQESILEKYKLGNTEGMHCFCNKSPKWSERMQSFILDFTERVDRASVRNFMLVDEKNESNVYLQFGKLDKQHFTIDFSWPLSPLQAFAIALTRLDH